MRKADALRAAIVAVFPALEQQPQQLKIWLEKGRVVAVRRPGDREALEYRYRLCMLFLDFADDADVLFAAIVTFLAVEQPSVGLAGNGKEAGFDFEAEILDDKTVDVMVGLDLVEAVTKSDLGFTHHAEPMLDDDDILGGDFASADGIPVTAE